MFNSERIMSCDVYVKVKMRAVNVGRRFVREFEWE